MVKGISRQVIVVKSPDPRLFEQAVFFLRDSPALSGVTAEQIIDEACRVANGYVRRKTGWGRRLRRIPPLGFFLAGAFVSSLAWFFAAVFPAVL